MMFGMIFVFGCARVVLERSDILREMMRKRR